MSSSEIPLFENSDIKEDKHSFKKELKLKLNYYSKSFLFLSSFLKNNSEVSRNYLNSILTSLTVLSRGNVLETKQVTQMEELNKLNDTLLGNNIVESQLGLLLTYSILDLPLKDLPNKTDPNIINAIKASIEVIEDIKKGIAHSEAIANYILSISFLGATSTIKKYAKNLLIESPKTISEIKETLVDKIDHTKSKNEFVVIWKNLTIVLLDIIHASTSAPENVITDAIEDEKYKKSGLKSVFFAFFVIKLFYKGNHTIKYNMHFLDMSISSVIQPLVACLIAPAIIKESKEHGLSKEDIFWLYCFGANASIFSTPSIHESIRTIENNRTIARIEATKIIKESKTIYGNLIESVTESSTFDDIKIIQEIDIIE